MLSNQHVLNEFPNSCPTMCVCSESCQPRLPVAAPDCPASSKIVSGAGAVPVDPMCADPRPHRARMCCAAAIDGRPQIAIVFLNGNGCPLASATDLSVWGNREKWNSSTARCIVVCIQAATAQKRATEERRSLFHGVWMDWPEPQCTKFRA